jgi:dTDP-4-dehydrorhamnose 3,5-epimerase-like enzyme
MNMKDLKERITIISRQLIKDERGWFLKAINGKEDGLPLHTGEIYFTSATSGQSKGGHYHIKAKEWFTLIHGKAILQLEDIKTHERMNLELDAAFPVTVFIPQLVAHTIVNEYEENFILCAYTDVLYDPDDTVQYYII